MFTALTPTPFRPTVFLEERRLRTAARVHLPDGRRERLGGMPRP